MVAQAPEDPRKQPVSSRGVANKGSSGLKSLGEIQLDIFIFVLLHLVGKGEAKHSKGYADCLTV